MSSRGGGKKTMESAAAKRGGAPWALAMLLVMYLALATAYNLATPVGVSPDELGHAEYIRYLVTHHRPPVFGARGLVYEAHQPPLYYLLAAPVWAAAGPGPEPARLLLTEWHQRAGVYVLTGRAAAEGRAVRLLTTLIGGIGLALIWALVGVLYPGDCWLRIGATALAAFLPMRLALAAAVSNDLLLEALFSASLLAMALMIRRGYTHRRAGALGAALGAAVLTKTTGVVLLLPALVTLLIVSRRRPTRRAAGFDTALFFHACLRAFGIAALLAGPWLLRNRILYGDFLAAHAFAAYFTQVQSTPQALMAHLGMAPARFWIKIVGLWTYSSFWGVFGPFTVWMAPSVYHALLVPTAIAPVGIVLQARRERQEPDERRQLIWRVLALSLVLVAFGYVRYNLLIVEPQSRFLLAAMAPIALLLTLGWLAFVPRRARPLATVLMALGMAALAVYAVAGIIVPYYR